MSAQELANRQINDTNSLVQLVLSLNDQQGNDPTNTTFRIGGIGTALFGQGTESSVALVVDGVAQARRAQSFADLAEVERVEVLEGPQGTLPEPHGCESIRGRDAEHEVLSLRASP